MKFEWDEAKNIANLAKHKLPFAVVLDFPWHEAALYERSRESDGEQRYAAVGLFRGKLHTVIFTKRGTVTRIISLRRSNAAEERAYEKDR